MDKMTRLLLLYSKLMRGEKVNKTLFCLEADCQPRSFDRDVEDVRLFLSDSFAMEELIYDRGEKVYRLSGRRRGELDATECLFLETLLRDGSFLREEEFYGLLHHLHSASARVPERATEERYVPPAHGRPLLKLFGDLQTVLRKNFLLSLKVADGVGKEREEKVFPDGIRVSGRRLVFFARSEESLETVSYPLEEILSFQVIREMTPTERQRVRVRSENEKEERGEHGTDMDVKEE